MSALHREHPEASPEQIEAMAKAALLRAPMVADDSEEPERVTRECRDCGVEFALTLEAASRPASKWTALCGSCLAHEL